MRPTPLDRDEYVEQAYFFRTFRERLADNQPAQDVLTRAPDELLATTRLPMAVQFLATELKHTGLLANGFAKLPHYFARFQTFCVAQAESETSKFPLLTALLVLEREAAYKAAAVTRAGLFVYQFETLTRNRLKYLDGLDAMSADPHYDDVWAAYIDTVRRQVGVIDFADLIFVRSEQYLTDRRRTERDYQPPVPPVFGEKEGKIARASRGREPLFLFAALQRQLGYPEVPRFKPRDDAATLLENMQVKVRALENRLKLLEGEVRGNVDLSQFGKPDILNDDPPG